jgi:WD40 repeat protein
MKDPDRLRERLRDAPLPREAEARERGWRVVRAAFVGQPARPAPAHRRGRLAIALAGAALLAVLVLTPAGAKVVDAFRSVTGIGKEQARGALSSLPAPGRLLIGSAEGTWVVSGDGSKRLLGDFGGATWSPHGLFVAATAGEELAAVDPTTATVHWTLARPRPIDPAWSPSGFRIAYLSGNDLRLVDGAGHGDRPLVRHVAATTPAWEPLGHRARLLAEKGTEPRERLAYADRAGRVHLVVAATGRSIWTSSPDGKRPQLVWTSSGARLVAVGRRSVRVFTASGSLERTIALPAGARTSAAAIAPSGQTLALALSVANKTAAARGRVEILDLGVGAPEPRVIVSDPGRFTDVAFSPDGRWLLAAWRDADEWLFVPLGGGRVKAVGHISQQFAPGSSAPSAFPRVDGWCCESR